MRIPLIAASLAWLVHAVTALAARGAEAMRFALPGPDDHMRLLQVRELLAGRAWHDLLQPRLGLGDGLAFHWSRLPDIPIALFTLALAPFAGEAAQGIAVALWPPILLLAVFATAALAASRIWPGPAAAVAAPLLMLTAYRSLAQFDPGRIDHHNLQIVLAMTALLAVLAAGARPPWALLAGVAGALAIAIGIEGVPYVVAAAGVLALRSLGGARGDGDALALCGAALSGALVLLYLQTGAWRTIYAESCIAFSSVYLSAGLLLGAGCLASALAFARLASAPARLGSGALIAVAAIGLFVALYPMCPAMAWSPEGRGLAAAGFDAELARLWLGSVQETRTIVELARADPGAAIANHAFPAAALLGCVALWRLAPERRREVAACAVFLGAAVAVSLFQNRAAIFSQALAVPPAAALLAVLWTRARSEPRRLAAFAGAALLLNGMSFAAIDRMLAGEASASAGGERACVDPDALAPLAALPPGRVAAPINLGPAILAHTPHSVLAAPYSTNLESSLAAYRVFALPPEAAAAEWRAVGADYVAACLESPETRNFQRRYPDGTLARLARGEPVAGLAPEGDGEGPLRVFRTQSPQSLINQ